MGMETVIRLVDVSVHPLASVTTKLRSCVKLVTPKGVEGSLKIVFRSVSDERREPSTYHSYVIGSSPSDALTAVMFPPLHITF